MVDPDFIFPEVYWLDIFICWCRGMNFNPVISTMVNMLENKMQGE